VRQATGAYFLWLQYSGLDKSVSGGKADLILLNARCKERMRKLCVFRDGLHFPGLFKMGGRGGRPRCGRRLVFKFLWDSGFLCLGPKTVFLCPM
jgi:hypothetical protein